MPFPGNRDILFVYSNFIRVANNYMVVFQVSFIIKILGYLTLWFLAVPRFPPKIWGHHFHFGHEGLDLSIKRSVFSKPTLPPPTIKILSWVNFKKPGYEFIPFHMSYCVILSMGLFSNARHLQNGVPKIQKSNLFKDKHKS